MEIDELVSALQHNLRAVIYQAGLSNATIARLRRDHPEGKWSFNGGIISMKETVWLHFADANERRMWWVLVADNLDEVIMTWDFAEIPDLI